MSTEAAKATVMLVDDTPANLRYLQEILQGKGYRVVAFPQGEAALRAAAKSPPEMVLLDIMMPEMDGFEVCRRLKADPELGKIPVLFISALSDQEDKAKAFAAGGVDYVTKPFEQEEVLSRVATHLKLYRLTRELERIVEDRTALLVEANAALRQEILIRQEAEARLRAYQSLLQAVFEGVTEPLLLVDRDMRVKLFNKSASDYYAAAGIDLPLGARICDCVGEGRPGLCGDCILPVAVLRDVTITEERTGFSDPERIEQVVVYPVLEAGERTGDAIIRIRDVTEERRLSQEMAQADKLIALGTVAAGVAHEINNPNHVILLNVQLLADIWQGIQPVLDGHFLSRGDFPIGKLRYSQLKPDIPALFSDIESSAGRIKRIVEVLKDYAVKKDYLTRGPVDINKVVANAVLLMGHKIKQSTHRFTVSYGKDLPSLSADQQKLEQVFVNLIANAVESLPDKHRAVYVSTSHDREARQVRVEVRDEGVGIPPSLLSRITDPFFTTKRATGGTGLGMAIVQQFVSLHKGVLQVESKEGEGSTFRVLLPQSRPMEGCSSAPAYDDFERGAP